MGLGEASKQGHFPARSLALARSYTRLCPLQSSSQFKARLSFPTSGGHWPWATEVGLCTSLVNLGVCFKEGAAVSH